jgi:hypothetical protein
MQAGLMAADSIVAPPPWRAIMQRPLPPCFRVPVERFRGKGSAACAQRSGQIESMNNGVLTGLAIWVSSSK